MPKIGVFDSGYGGLTVLRSLLDRLPQFDFVYLGDNARAPYGNRSFETVYQYTLQCVNWLFDQADCDLVILACNTASAKALRQIQQCDLPLRSTPKRLLGVIRPTTEQLGEYTRSGHVGILGTQGTVDSQSYPIELAKFFPELFVSQEACPLWVPLVEEGRLQEPESHALIQERLDALMAQDEQIDTLLLACTHYPLLLPLLEQHAAPGMRLLSQGDLVAERLEDYLRRHSAFASHLDQNSDLTFFTTGDSEQFRSRALVFFGQEVKAESVQMGEV
ncbi:MAG: glutamate racemase [Bacteroidota bacterium]